MDGDKEERQQEEPEIEKLLGLYSVYTWTLFLKLYISLGHCAPACRCLVHKLLEDAGVQVTLESQELGQPPPIDDATAMFLETILFLRMHTERCLDSECPMYRWLKGLGVRVTATPGRFGFDVQGTAQGTVLGTTVPPRGTQEQEH